MKYRITEIGDIEVLGAGLKLEKMQVEYSEDKIASMLEELNYLIESKLSFKLESVEE